MVPGRAAGPKIVIYRAYKFLTTFYRSAECLLCFYYRVKGDRGRGKGDRGRGEGEGDEGKGAQAQTIVSKYDLY